MHRSSSWRPTVSALSAITSAAPQRTGRRFAGSFVGRTSARATVSLRMSLDSTNEETLPSIDAIATQRRAQAKQTASAATLDSGAVAPSPLDSPEGLEQEAQQQGAFNEETGEINWDCPCLGGMADGPCGEQFKAAFSCFVFSKEEPKGIDCIEHFKTMQNCFREHPDIYGSELDDDDGADIDVEAPQPGVQHAVDVAREKVNDAVEKTADVIHADASKVAEAVPQVSGDKPAATIKNTAARKASTQQKLPMGGEDSEGELVPKAWHDSTADNDNISSSTQK
ncbi:hypothetical protein AMS68_006644 [Peltaster fructicola]|uniref:Mitochondrial intermembrane space import and assembly protein 40 n=1 Tax=Peltaster fructicola TaxID=286661 RepID=A0A6H0Y2A9_9PEZI|nr:hypothetical protein AMS68_006644 [Peltaster fructicola]